MSLRINQNISAMSAHRFLTSNDANMSKQIEKLSSGLRINSAADDAAGLVISENLRTQVSGLTQASRNTQDGINMIKTTEAALNEIETQLRNIRDLTINAANANGNTQTLVADQASITQGLASINRIAEQTEFAGIKLLGSNNIDGKQFQVGANAGQVAQFSLSGVAYDGVSLSANMHASALGLTGTQNASATAGKEFSGISAADVSATESFSVVYTAADGTVKTGNVVLNNATGDTLAHAVTAINSALNDAANIEAVATDSTGSSTAATKNYLTIRQKAVADKDSAASVVVLTDKSSTASATGFTSTPTTATGRNSSQSIDVAAVSANFDNILNQLDTSLKMVNGLRVHLGAFQKNNMESNLTSLSVAKENISASESAIRDTDMAAEMVSFTKSQILMQASQAMLTQANQAPQGILSMLR